MNGIESSKEIWRRLSGFLFAESIENRSRDLLLQGTRLIDVPKGRVVLQVGQTCDPIPLVSAGEIRVYASSPQGREITLYTVGPGEICVLALCAVLGRQPYSATVETTADLEGVAVPATHFRTLFDTDRAIREFVIEMYSRRLEATMSLVSEVAFERMEQRLANFLTLRSSPADDGRSTLAMTHEEIASELGTAREVVTRLLVTFASRQWVSMSRGRITVEDRCSLSRYSKDNQ